MLNFILSQFKFWPIDEKHWWWVKHCNDWNRAHSHWASEFASATAFVSATKWIPLNSISGCKHQRQQSQTLSVNEPLFDQNWRKINWCCIFVVCSGWVYANASGQSEERRWWTDETTNSGGIQRLTQGDFTICRYFMVPHRLEKWECIFQSENYEQTGKVRECYTKYWKVWEF